MGILLMWDAKKTAKARIEKDCLDFSAAERLAYALVKCGVSDEKYVS